MVIEPSTALFQRLLDTYEKANANLIAFDMDIINYAFKHRTERWNDVLQIGPLFYPRSI